MATAQTVINSAMKQLAVLSQGESPSSEESADALAALNTMLDSWSTESLSVFDVATHSHVLTGAASYTVGSGGVIAITRPIDIKQAFVRNSSGSPADYPLRVVNQYDWNQIITKSTSSTYPTVLFYDPEFPLGVIYLWPVPTAAFTLFFDAVAQLTQFATLATVFSFPPGYERAMIFNLAVEMAAQFGVEPTRRVVELANKALANIKRANIKIPQAEFEMGVRGRPYNINTDQ